MKTLTLIVLVLATVGCGESAEEGEGPIGDISFSSQVAPILRGGCAVDGCHAAPGKGTFSVPNGQSSNDRELYDSLFKLASSGRQLVDPGRTANSEVITRLDAEVGLMPPLLKLPVDQINVLRFWVANGAPDN